jgi:hypothetical protein
MIKIEINNYEIEIYPKELGLMDWNSAINICKSLGENWRLPNKEELIILHDKLKNIFIEDIYWGNELDNEQSYTMFFFDGKINHFSKNDENIKNQVRPVKTIL